MNRTSTMIPSHPTTRYIQLFAVILGMAALVSPLQAIEVTTSSLRTTEAKIKALVKKNLPATIALIPANPKQMYGVGSGVIINEDGLILTAAHVTMGMNERVTVLFPDGTKARGKVLGMDYTRDSGMVQITDGGKYPFVEIGDSKKLKENDWCIALGHAGGFQKDRPPPVRLGRMIENDSKRFLRTDSALISGDSGGPLFDIDGKLIGIHSNIGTSLSQNNHVPITTYKENWQRLLEGDRFGGDQDESLLVNPQRPVIGATLTDIPGRKGSIIESVRRGSPASKAGLRKGDFITKIGGTAVEDTVAVIEKIRESKPGQTIRLTVISGKAVRVVPVRLVSASKLGGSSLAPQAQRTRGFKRSVEEEQELWKEFSRVLDESIAAGKLKLTENHYQKFNSPDDFNRFMERYKKTLTKAELKTLYRIATPKKAEPIRPGALDPDKEVEVSEQFFRDVLDSFRPSNVTASHATHHVFRGQEWKSLCTVIHEDGYALTKASEINTQNNQKLGVLIGKGKLVSAKLVKDFPDFDLALIKLETNSKLSAVNLRPHPKMQPGSMISAPGTGRDPIAIGLISVEPRSLITAANKGFLGIGTGPHSRGVEVTQVVQGASAHKAGIQIGDVILKIDKVACRTPNALVKQISGKRPGTDVIIQLLRNGRGSTFKVRLGDRKQVEGDTANPAGRMNSMGTRVSEVNSGFPKVTQTDLPIQPEHCGGPVVDLAGRVVGINIARGGRIKSYMVPTEEILKLVTPLLPKPSKAIR